MNLKHLGFSQFLEEEEVVSGVFRHPVSTTFIRMFFFATIWGTIAWLVHFYWANYYYDYSIDNQYNFLWVIPAVVGGIKVFNVFMKWYANAILMTNESLVFAQFNHIFDRKIARIDYWDLDDVELEKKGLADYLGNRGDLVFSKISGGKPEEFKKVNNPRKIIKVIRQHKIKMINEKNFTEEGALKNLLSQLVQTHVRDQGQPEKAREFHEEIIKKEEHLAKSLTTEDFARMREEELNKLRKSEKRESLSKTEKTEENSTRNFLQKSNSSVFPNEKKEKLIQHFHNELEILPKEGEINIEVEKELDDEGGLEIDLD